MERSGQAQSGARQSSNLSPITHDLLRSGSPEVATKKFALKDVHCVSTPLKGRGRKENRVEREVKRQGRITKPRPHGERRDTLALFGHWMQTAQERHGQARLLSAPEADAKGAGNGGLSADCTACSWAQGLLAGTSGQHTCAYHTGCVILFKLFTPKCLLHLQKGGDPNCGPGFVAPS